MSIAIVLLFLITTNYLIYRCVPLSVPWKKQAFFLGGLLIYHMLIGTVYGILSEVVLNGNLYVKSFTFFVLHSYSVALVFFIYLFSFAWKFFKDLTMFKNINVNMNVVKVVLIILIFINQLIFLFSPNL